MAQIISVALGFSATCTPPNVRSWAGFPDDFSEKAQAAFDPSITPMSALMEANDNGQSFKTIAKLIEKYL